MLITMCNRVCVCVDVEIYIPPASKTIKPIDMGGYAVLPHRSIVHVGSMSHTCIAHPAFEQCSLHGGQKFYNGGVLFKVSIAVGGAELSND
jgi:hypothetical protein